MVTPPQTAIVPIFLSKVSSRILSDINEISRKGTGGGGRQEEDENCYSNKDTNLDHIAGLERVNFMVGELLIKLLLQIYKHK